VGAKGTMGRAIGGERMSPESDVRELRGKTPSSDLRAAAPAGDIGREAWTCPTLTAGQSAIIAMLNLPQISIETQQNVLIGRDAGRAQRLYLQRLAPSYPADSGWYIGSADEPHSSSLYATALSRLLAFRPDFRDILALPEGFLVVLEGGVITAILDPADRLVWTA